MSVGTPPFVLTRMFSKEDGHRCLSTKVMILPYGKLQRHKIEDTRVQVVFRSFRSVDPILLPITSYQVLREFDTGET